MDGWKENKVGCLAGSQGNKITKLHYFLSNKHYLVKLKQHFLSLYLVVLRVVCPRKRFPKHLTESCFLFFFPGIITRE